MTALAECLSALTGWRRFAAAALAGVSMTLGQAPVGWWWMTLLGIAALFLMLRGCGLRRAFFTGWSGGVGYFASGLFWIVEPFFVDAARDGWMAPFALAIMAGGLALFWGLGFWVGTFAALMERQRPLHAKNGHDGFIQLTLYVPMAWMLAEFLRANVLTGFPWAMISYVWIDTPVAQIASLTGPHILTFLTLLAGASIASAALFSEKGRWTTLLIGAMGLVIPAFWGIYVLNPERQPAETDTVLRLIQPNAAQHEKWRPDMQPVFFDRHRRLTAGEELPGAVIIDRRKDGEEIDAVIWPETAVAFLPDREPEGRRLIVEPAGGAPVILGARRVEKDGTWRNSMFLIGSDAEIAATYDKHHLVPFGEYMPFSDFFAATGIYSIIGDRSGFQAGPGPAGVASDVSGLPDFVAQICYETIFPNTLPGRDRDADQKLSPEWLLQITNDAWFGAYAGPYQHLAQARMRAIEYGMPVVRVANTGVSAVIDARGRITAGLPLNRMGRIDARLPAMVQGGGFYGKGGGNIMSEFIVWAILLFAPIAFGWANGYRPSP